ncbi:MAG: ABC transporter ATP-binding protein [Methylobacteriaceae bacterium]|nr:ABC transporter ATP-binding protein [Methylobacteriaceae bacterium]
MTVLEVRDLSVAYDDLVAVRRLSLSVVAGEIHLLLGPNGSGKTTTLRTISGLLRPRAGRVESDGMSLVGLTPDAVARSGIAHVPENRRVFSTLSVDDNLVASYLPGRGRKLASVRQDVFDLFPRLAERRKQLAGSLSGGEQQMVAIGRALMNAPKLMMLDEPSLGLAPLMTDLVFTKLHDIAGTGIAVLLVEQNASAIELADHGTIVANGEMLLSGDRAALTKSEFVARAYLSA